MTSESPHLFIVAQSDFRRIIIAKKRWRDINSLVHRNTIIVQKGGKMSEETEQHVSLDAVQKALEKFLAPGVIRDVLAKLEKTDLIVPRELSEKLGELQKSLSRLLEEKTRSLEALTNDPDLRLDSKGKRALKLYRLLEAVRFLLSQAEVDRFTVESVVSILQQVDLRNQQREVLREIRALLEEVKEVK